MCKKTIEKLFRAVQRQAEKAQSTKKKRMERIGERKSNWGGVSDGKPNFLLHNVMRVLLFFFFSLFLFLSFARRFELLLNYFTDDFFYFFCLLLLLFNVHVNPFCFVYFYIQKILLLFQAQRKFGYLICCTMYCVCIFFLLLNISFWKPIFFWYGEWISVDSNPKHRFVSFIGTVVWSVLFFFSLNLKRFVVDFRFFIGDLMHLEGYFRVK